MEPSPTSSDPNESSDIEHVLEFMDVHKTFHLGLALKRVHAVRGVGVKVGRGEIFGYLGPNGAGKTTSMKMALGLIKPSQGEIRVLGASIEDARIRRRVGYLPEHPYFYDYLSAREILDFFGQLYEIPHAARRTRVSELLELVGLTDAADRTLRRYSKGMLQRVGIAQAIINRPDLVILDEPLSGLDPLGRKEVRDIIVSLREEGTTVFFSSHILHDIETICDRVAIIIEGKIERLGHLDELLSPDEVMTDITLNHVSPELAGRLQEQGLEAQIIGEQWVCRVCQGDLNGVLESAIASGATVTHLQPYRQSLEELFVAQAGGHRGE